MFSHFKNTFNCQKCSEMLTDVKTFLSPKVCHIVCDLCKTRLQPITTVDGPVLLTNCELNWSTLLSLLPGESEDCYEYFVECVERLYPALQASLTILEVCEEDFTSHVLKYSTWMSQPMLVIEVFKISKQNNEICCVQGLLLLSTLFERSLGNLYLLKGKAPCPSMLKDLLLSNELKDILGPKVIQLLRMLIGPPISVNIRNVVWHGFPLPGEIPRQWLCILLLIVSNIGSILQDNNIPLDSVPQRPFLKFGKLLQVENKLTDRYMVLPKIEVLFVIEDSNLIFTSMLPFWKLALQEYEDARYNHCLQLLLPQLEHTLRCLFVFVNNVPNRLQTAENTTLFTTLDEILAPELPNGNCNALRSVLGDPCLSALLDIFTYPAGPRLRDRIGHGEFEFFAPSIAENSTDERSELWRLMATHTLVIITYICSQLSNLNHSYPWLDVIIKSMRVYTSVYHPLNNLKSCCCDVTNKVLKWRELPCDHSCQVLEADWKSQLCHGNKDVKQFAKMIWQKLEFPSASSRHEVYQVCMTTSFAVYY